MKLLAYNINNSRQINMADMSLCAHKCNMGVIRVIIYKTEIKSQYGELLDMM